MIDKGIVIYWENCTEFLSVDFNDLDSLREISKTDEYWHDEDKYVQYQVSSKLKSNNKNYTLTLKYDHSNNKDINYDDVCWGTSTIKLSQDKMSGEASWIDDDDKENDGTVEWERIDKPIMAKRKKSNIETTQRQQTKFRKLLLSLDKKCIITNEEMPEVLEAAHIIPVSENGLESANNGVIMRSDIHKLYDSGKFIISDDGSILVTNIISEEYETILKNAQIPKPTLLRVKKALIIKANKA